MASGTFSGVAKRVRVYLNEAQTLKSQPLYTAILEFLRKRGAAGATVFRGTEGFGSTGRVNTSRLVDVSRRLPVVVEWVDTPDRVNELLPMLLEMVHHGFVTVEETQVALFSPYQVQDVASTMCASDVMARDVVSVSPETPVKEVVELLVGKSYRALPVVREGRPVGIITNTDLLKRGGLSIRVDLLKALDAAALRAEIDKLGASGKTAMAVMTPHPVTVDQSKPLAEVAEMMAYLHLKRMPVVDDEGTMVGMISRLDVLRTAARTFRQKETAASVSGLAVDAPVSMAMRRDVPTVFLDTPLPEVLQAVVSTRLNRCIVVDQDRRVRGTVTDGEVLVRLTPAVRPSVLNSLVYRLPFVKTTPKEIAAYKRATGKIAADLMVPTETVPETALLQEAIAIMLGGQQKMIAVVDTEQRLVGCLDRADMLHGLVSRGAAQEM